MPWNGASLSEFDEKSMETETAISEFPNVRKALVEQKLVSEERKKNRKEQDSESESGVKGGVIWNRKIIAEFTRSIGSTKIAYPVLMMNAKSPKTNLLADGLIERTSSILDEITSKTVHKDKEGDW